MMDELERFVSENLGLVIVLGVVLLIVVDEILGISRGLLGDEADDLPATPKARAREERLREEAPDPLEDAAEDGEPTVEDFLPPPPAKKD